jgi:tRNA threonylcarbamoyladenosine biosynthesis protein TsaB
MMNILVIDTSTKRLCVGVLNQEAKLAEYNLNAGIRHTELLLPTIKRALRRVKLSLSEIDYFAVGLGPGSFTGLRIGLATVKGFAMSLKRPAVGLATLDTIALNALPASSKIISPLLDAKRNLLYCALYEVDPKNRLKRRSPYLLINIEELLNRLKPYKSVTLLGDGLSLYRERLEQRIKNGIFLNEDAWYPQAKNLINLAGDLIKKGRLSDAARIKPIYLYPKECQIRNADIHRFKKVASRE